MTQAQTPREYDQHLAALQGFEAYREVVSTSDIRHAQTELAHVFGNDIMLVDYSASHSHSPSRAKIISHDLGAKMVRKAFAVTGDLSEVKRAHQSVAEFAARKNKVVSTYGFAFKARPLAESGNGKTVVSLKIGRGENNVTADILGVALAVARYSNLALPTPPATLEFPLAITDSDAVINEIDDLCMTRTMHVPLGPLVIERKS